MEMATLGGGCGEAVEERTRNKDKTANSLSAITRAFKVPINLLSFKAGRRRQRLTLLLERVHYLLEPLPVCGDRLGGAGEFEEHVSTRALHDRAEQAIPGFNRLAGRH